MLVPLMQLLTSPDLKSNVNTVTTAANFLGTSSSSA